MTNEAELCVAIGLRELGLAVKNDYRFHGQRKWRLDVAEFMLPKDARRPKVAVEIEGAHWAQGRHTRGSGFEKDCEKYAEAAIAGYQVFRVTTEMALDGTAKQIVRRWLDANQ